MRIKIKPPKKNNIRTSFRMSEIDTLKETIKHQAVRIAELERMLKVDNLSASNQYAKAAHLAIKSVFPYYQAEYVKLHTRKREIVELRQIFLWLLRNKTTMPLKAIGRMCGNRHHTTVMHSTRLVNDLADTNKKYREDLDKIKLAFENFVN